MCCKRVTDPEHGSQRSNASFRDLKDVWFGLVWTRDRPNTALGVALRCRAESDLGTPADSHAGTAYDFTRAFLPLELSERFGDFFLQPQAST